MVFLVYWDSVHDQNGHSLSTEVHYEYGFRTEI